MKTWINVFNGCSGLHKHNVSQKHSALVATNSAGNCSEVSWKISRSFTLTNIETLSQTLLSFSAAVLPVTAAPPPPPPTVTRRSFTCNVLLIVNSTQPMTLEQICGLQKCKLPPFSPSLSSSLGLSRQKIKSAFKMRYFFIPLLKS